MILSGPNLEGLTPGRQLTADDLHRVHGVPSLHGAVGPGTLRVIDDETIAHRTRGAGRPIIPDRAYGWFALPGAKNPKAPGYGEHDGYDDVTVEFDVKFGNGAFTGWQAKFGYPLEGYKSNKRYPGGNWQSDPDWSIRPIWNRYPRNTSSPDSGGRHPLRFGLYVYSTGRDKAELPDQTWATPTNGGGYRRAVLFDELTPTEDRWYRYGIRLSRPKSGKSVVAVSIDGSHVWSGNMLLLTPANRSGLQSAYGGSEAKEGPKKPVDVFYRRWKVTLDE